MKIEERASDYFHELLHNGKDVSHAIDANKAYIKGATAQRKIDINNACKWLDENLIEFVEYDHLNGICIDYERLYKQFRKAMEE